MRNIPWSGTSSRVWRRTGRNILLWTIMARPSYSAVARFACSMLVVTAPLHLNSPRTNIQSPRSNKLSNRLIPPVAQAAGKHALPVMRRSLEPFCHYRCPRPSRNAGRRSPSARWSHRDQQNANATLLPHALALDRNEHAAAARLLSAYEKIRMWYLPVTARRPQQVGQSGDERPVCAMTDLPAVTTMLMSLLGRLNKFGILCRSRMYHW